MPANIRETLIGISFRKQADLATLPGAANFWRVAKTNVQLADGSLVTESDALDVGKGDEFASNIYLLNWNAAIQLEAYMTSQKLAWAAVFGLGKFTKTTPEAGAYTYTCVPADPVVDGIDSLPFSYVEQIRPGGSAVLDRAFVGCAINAFRMNLNSGLGRQNATLAVEAIGTGKQVQPSTITLPAPLAETSLNASSMALTILGTNYVSLKRIVSVESGFNNNVRADQGFFPGSGTDNGAALRGRMERGDREITMSVTARFENGSTELTNILAQTEGTAVLSLTGALIAGTTYHGCTLTLHKCRISAATVGESDGIVTVQINLTAMKHASNGVLTMVVTTNQDNIGAAAV